MRFKLANATFNLLAPRFVDEIELSEVFFRLVKFAQLCREFRLVTPYSKNDRRGLEARTLLCEGFDLVLSDVEELFVLFKIAEGRFRIGSILRYEDVLQINKTVVGELFANLLRFRHDDAFQRAVAIQRVFFEARILRVEPFFIENAHHRIGELGGGRVGA